ncbi:hypothetical protein, partial [Aquimarina macrocephali]|uniref:hypothetical protein n=1 Tax=Aquimarina macrocephali TaxID=666563 RepID=UPI00054E8365
CKKEITFRLNTKLCSDFIYNVVKRFYYRNNFHTSKTKSNIAEIDRPKVNIIVFKFSFLKIEMTDSMKEVIPIKI